MSGTPASGSAVLFGLRQELRFGVPDLSKPIVWHELDLPLAMELVRSLGATLETDSRGFAVRGIPAAITGPVDMAWPLRASTFLEVVEHGLGGRGVLAKSTLETGVYQYLGTPTRVNGDTSYGAVVCLAPVDRQRPSGIKWNQLVIPIGPGEIPARMAGLFAHSTHMSAADQDSGTGTYALGPDIRGPVRRPRAGETIHIKATRTVAGGGLQLKAELVPAGAAPTFPGAALDAYYDSEGNGDWANLSGAYQLTGTVSVAAGGTALAGVGTKFLDELVAGKSFITIAGETKAVTAVASNTAATIAAHTAGAAGVVAHLLNQDFGYWGENRDTLDFIYPGTVTDHGDIDLNDIWIFSAEWDNPTPTYISGQRFTSAHWFVYWRRRGATVWNPLEIEGNGTFTVPWPATANQGWSTRHYTGITREGVLLPTLQVSRKYTSREFAYLKEEEALFEMRLEALGQRIGPSQGYRESIRFDTKGAEITTRTAPIAGPAALVETLNIAWKASEDGDPPLTTTIITDRNYDVAAA
jgi:hypothetical protein